MSDAVPYARGKMHHSRWRTFIFIARQFLVQRYVKRTLRKLELSSSLKRITRGLMINLPVCGLLLASLLFLAPSFIFLNVGFRCSRLFNTSEDIMENSFCVKVDEELAYVLIGSGFIFLLFAIATLGFSFIVYLNSRQSKRKEPETEISAVWLWKICECGRLLTAEAPAQLSNEHHYQLISANQDMCLHVESFQTAVKLNYLMMWFVPVDHPVKNTFTRTGCSRCMWL